MQTNDNDDDDDDNDVDNNNIVTDHDAAAAAAAVVHSVERGVIEKYPGKTQCMFICLSNRNNLCRHSGVNFSNRHTHIHTYTLPPTLICSPHPCMQSAAKAKLLDLQEVAISRISHM